MTAKVGFFNANDPLTLGGGWEVQTVSKSWTKDRKQGLKKNGDEAASKLNNQTDSLTIEYKNFESEGTLSLPPAGEIRGGYHLDGLTLRLDPNDWPTLSIPVHKHMPTTHADDSCRTYTPSIAIDAGFGIPRNGLGGFGVAVGDTGIGFSSFEYSLTLTHVDEPGDQGDWLAGENRDGAETVQIGLIGRGATVSAPVGWDKLSEGEGEGNTNSDSETHSWEHHIEADVEGGGEE